MIKIENIYKKNKASGLHALRVFCDQIDDINDVAVSFSTNHGIVEEFKISSFDFNDNDFFEFALNTYRFEDGFNKLEVEISGSICSIDLCVFNTSNVGSFVKATFFNRNLIFPYPVHADLWADVKQLEFKAERDQAYYITHKDSLHFDTEGWCVFESGLESTLIESARKQLIEASDMGHDDFTQGSSKRMTHLHAIPGPICEIFNSESIRQLISALYGTSMIPCQTLSFRYGSQQSWHSDWVHLTPFPENLMCGVWLALEDVHPDAGPLGLISKSHKESKLKMSDFNLTAIRNSDYSSFNDTFVQEWTEISKRYPSEIALLKSGQLLVWDGNLLHCGTARKNHELSRCSVVMHFFADGGVCIYDSLGIVGNPN